MINAGIIFTILHIIEYSNVKEEIQNIYEVLT